MIASCRGFNPEYSQEAPSFAEVASLSGDVLLEFGTPWCGHCQGAQAAVAEVVGELADITHIKVYDGKGKVLGRAFKVKLWPTLILLRDGQEIARIVRPVAVAEVQQLFA